MEEHIRARIAALEESRAKWLDVRLKADVNLQQHEGALAELRRLLAEMAST